jgi:hypothetical protein
VAAQAEAEQRARAADSAPSASAVGDAEVRPLGADARASSNAVAAAESAALNARVDSIETIAFQASNRTNKQTNKPCAAVLRRSDRRSRMPSAVRCRRRRRPASEATPIASSAHAAAHGQAKHAPCACAARGRAAQLARGQRGRR